MKVKILYILMMLSVLSQPVQSAVAMDFSPLVEKVSTGVVRVNVTKKADQEALKRVYEAKVLRQFFGNQIQVPQIVLERGYGTGFFVSHDGYILTNHHVIEGADKVSVTLQDRTELDAKLIGSDEASDVAVLKVNGQNFFALDVAKNDTLKVGEPVLAIGSPFGFDYSASSGIVSAKSRNMTREAVVPFIQTDVALNQGNSGGPLFNQKGEVVGINSLIFSRTGGYMGLSFSIPIGAAMDIYEQIRTTGRVSRVYLGVALQDIDRNLAQAYRLDKPKGALIGSVHPDSPAKKVGLKMGDLVLEFDGQPIVQASDLLNKINRAKPLDTFELVYQRQGEQYRVQGQFALQDEPSTKQVRLGVTLQELSDQENRALRAFGIKGGVQIRDVDMGAMAGMAGLLAGDIVISLNQMPTDNAQSFGQAVAALPERGIVPVGVIRGGRPMIVGLRLE